MNPNENTKPTDIIKNTEALFTNIDATTFVSEIKKDDKEVVQVVIGDEKQLEFFPRAKIKKWDNEVNFSIGVIDPNPTIDSIVTNEGDIISWDKENITARFYNKDVIQQESKTPIHIPEHGAFEFDIILKSRPDINFISLSIQAKELDFFYQPPLTEEEKVSLKLYRPKNVEGSYAVYHKTLKGDYTALGGKNYETGKAFHIYRPEIIDANNVRVYGELSIDETAGLLTVTIPQDFIDNAAYPIVVDPTFGYTTQGASDYALFAASTAHKAAMQGVAITGTLSKMSAYLKILTGSTTGSFEMFAEASSLPTGSALVSGSVSPSASTYTLIETSQSLSLAGANYWVSYYDTGDAKGVVTNVAFDSGAGATTSDTGTWGSIGNNFSIYATYTTGGATPVTVPTLLLMGAG